MTISTPNSGMTSKTTTGQHRDARVEQAKATALPEKSKHSFANSRYGLFPTRPAIDQKQVMQEAAGFLEQEKPKAVNFEPKNTVGNMIKHAAGNFMKNTIVTEVTPILKSSAELAELNLKYGLLAVSGGGAKLGYEAMSVGSRVIAGKALLGGAQGWGGSMVAGGDRYDQLFSSGVGAFIGILTAQEFNPFMTNLSPVTVGMASGGVSNALGQRFSIARSSEPKSFSYVSLGVSAWAGSIAGLITRYGAAGITGATIQSTVQIPADVLGSHISEDYSNAHR